jgi:hypothetical protein
MPFDSFEIETSNVPIIDASQVFSACLYRLDVPVELRKIIMVYMGFPLFYYHLQTMLTFAAFDVKKYGLQPFEMRKYAYTHPLEMLFSNLHIYRAENPDLIDLAVGMKFKYDYTFRNIRGTYDVYKLPLTSCYINAREFERQIIKHFNMNLSVQEDDPIQPEDVAKERTNEHGEVEYLCDGGCLKHYKSTDCTIVHNLLENNLKYCMNCYDAFDFDSLIKF